MEENTAAAQSRSDRFIPLAERIMALLTLEPDPEVRFSAFDVAKMAVDARRRRHNDEIARVKQVALEARLTATKLRKLNQRGPKG